MLNLVIVAAMIAVATILIMLDAAADWYTSGGLGPYFGAAWVAGLLLVGGLFRWAPVAAERIGVAMLFLFVLHLLLSIWR